MVKALRITVAGDVPYEQVTIYSHYLGDSSQAPDLFEDAQLVFTCKHGKFVVPDYNVTLVQLRTGRIAPPDDCIRAKRILLWGDLNYQDCYIIQQADYAKYGIPQIFREYEQMTFICKDGLFITTDIQVKNIHLWS